MKFRSPLLLTVLATVSGCVPLIIGGGAETARLASQERTMGSAVDDGTVFLKIKNQFAHAPSNDLFANVEIRVTEGRVLLTGNVDQPDSQIEAVRLTWLVDGVKEVINEIQVNDKSGFANYSKDVWISTQVRSRLLFTKEIRSSNYSVITVNQNVYLTGIAQDQAELDRATWVASTTQYVQKVVSYVKLKDDPTRKNAPQ
jgi:osmotically-inducible protein OsmY